MKASFVEMEIVTTVRIFENGELSYALYNEKVKVDPQEVFLREIAKVVINRQSPVHKLIHLANLGVKSDRR